MIRNIKRRNINNNYLICVDLETTDKYPDKAYPTEIACKIYDGRSLQEVADGEFCTLCKPPPQVEIKQEALDITGIKREDIEKAPLISVVWPQFVSFVEKFNKRKSKWGAPIAMGHNIRNFDLPIISRMSALYGAKKKDTIIFSDFRCIDLMDILFLWFENSNELENYKLNTVRPYFGMSNSGGHRAMADVKATGDLIIRFMKYYRAVMKADPTKFKGAFAK